MSIDIKHCYLSALYYTAKEVTVGWVGGVDDFLCRFDLS